MWSSEKQWRFHGNNNHMIVCSNLAITASLWLGKSTTKRFQANISTIEIKSNSREILQRSNFKAPPSSDLRG